MQKHPKLGEIIIPGPARNSGIRSFILTGTNASGNGTEMLFGLLAAEAPKRIVDKLVDRLIDEVRSSFFSPEVGVEERYEHALKQVNSSILAFLHEHHLSLPGIKLRGVMVALSGDILLVSNRGSLKGMLIMKRGEKAITLPLFPLSADTSTNPKFFSSFQQGTMPPGAIFIAGTKELFTAIDESFLKKVFTERSPDDAGREIRKGLSDKPNVAALILAMPAEVVKESPAASGMAPPPTLANPKARRAQKNTLPINMAIGAVGAHTIEGIFVFLLSYLKLIPKALKALFRGGFSIVRLLTLIPSAIKALFDSTKRKKILTVAKAAPKRIARFGLHRFNNLPIKSKIHLLLLIAVSALFVHGILYSFQKHSDALAAKTYEARLAEIGQLQTDLETSIIIGNDRRSYDAISKLATMIEYLPGETTNEIKTKHELAQELETQRNKIRRYVTITNPEILIEFEDPNRVFSEGSFTWFERALYLFSPSGTAVKVFGLDGSSTDKTISTPSPIKNVAPARTGILLALEDDSIAFWNPDSEELTIYSDISLNGSPILFYQGRLYSVRADGMIERRPILDGKLGTITEVLQSPSDIKQPTSVAADGAAYLLSNEGQIRKYLKGSLVSGFQSPIIDPTPTRAEKLWADVDSRWLVFLEKSENRIIMVDSATGRLAAQLVSPTFGNISAMTIDDGGNFAYLVSGRRIIAVPLKGPGIN